MNSDDWRGEHLIRSRLRAPDAGYEGRPPPTGGSMVKRPKPKGQMVPCAVAGCDRLVIETAVSKVCREHVHAPGACQCPQCRGKG
jgi:hypothetical protein